MQEVTSSLADQFTMARMGRPRAATVGECRWQVPKPPLRKPSSPPPRSPPTLVLPPVNAEGRFPVLDDVRHYRSQSVDFGHMGFLVGGTDLNCPKVEGVPRPSSSRIVTMIDLDELPECVEEEEHIINELNESTDNVLVDDFPVSPVLRNCLQQLSSRFSSYSSNASSPQ